MYFKTLNILICSADRELEGLLQQVKPLDRFGHNFRTISNQGDLVEEQLGDSCPDADIIILDVAAGQIPANLPYLCATLHPRFVYCERPERGFLTRPEQVELFQAIWTFPLTPERVRLYFSLLLQELKAKYDVRLNRQCLETTIDSLPDLIWFKDTRGAHLKVNRSFCKLVGKTKEQCRGRGHYYIWDMDAEEYAQGEYVCLESEEVVMQAKRTCIFDEKLKGLNGRMLQFRTYKSPILDEDGKVIGTMGVARDVSDLHKLSQELRLILESIPTPALLTDAEGKIINVNKLLLKMTEETEVSLVGQSYASWKEHCFNFNRVLAAGEKLQLSFRTGAGENLQLEISEEPIYDIFKQTVGYFCLFRDITEHLNHVNLLLNYQKQLEADVAEKTEKIQSIQQQILISFADLINSRDSITGSHIKNTSKYVHLIVNELRSLHFFKELDNYDYYRNVIRSAPMHDIGKIAIPDVILNKPGRFAPEEYEIMKHHAALGGEILDKVLAGLENPDYYQVARDMAVYHHEKWDGTGCPTGKKGEEIPLSARIMAVADVFDALISERPYKKPFSVDKAYEIIENDAGHHFDAQVVKAFVLARPALEMAIEDTDDKF